MVFDLKAVLSLKDSNFSGGMRKAERVTRTTQRAMDGLTKSTNHTRDANGRLRDSMGRFVGGSNRMAGSIGKLKLGLGGLVGALGGVAAAYAAVGASKKVFESTVLEAAKFEQSTVIIGAMFDDKKLSKQYTDMMDKFAVDSPIMNSQDMYSNSKSFIQTSKNLKDLEKMWDLTERMAAVDPIQGVEGSVFALRELFSGDSQSMVERFEMPRKIMNEIKKLPLEEQLSALDSYFNKIGMTTKLVDEMGGTTLGLWARVREQFALVLRDMGTPSLEVISSFLTQVIGKLEGGSMDRFANVGARWIKNILTGLTNGAMGIYDWFDTLTSSEEFRSKTSLSSKISFVIEDLFQRFSGWMETTGKEQLTKATKFMMEVAASGLMAAQTPLVEAATNIGIAVGKALGSAASKEIKASVDNYLSGIELPGLAPVKIGGYIGKGISDLVSGGGKSKSIKKSGKSKSTSSSSSTKTPSVARIQPKIPVRGSFNAGTDRIHSDGLYRLHKDEAVLNRGKADKYRNGGGIGGITIAKLADQIIIREEADIDRITDKLVRKLIAAGEAGA